MTNAYSAAGRVYTLDTTGTIWANTFGSVPSESIGPKWVTRLVYYPGSADDDAIFDTASGGSSVFNIKAGNTDTSPVSIDFSSENNGKGRRVHDLYLTTLDGGTIYVYVA